MPRQQIGILAVFTYLDSLTNALKQLKTQKGFDNLTVYSPSSYHQLIDIAHEMYGESDVKWLALIGCVLGVSSGFFMPVLMDYDWPLVVGGKTAGLNSVIPNIIFMFELFILLGALATIVGMLWFGKMANPRAKVLDRRLTDDHFAIFVPNILIDSDQAKLLKDLGAAELKIID